MGKRSPQKKAPRRRSAWQAGDSHPTARAGTCLGRGRGLGDLGWGSVVWDGEVSEGLMMMMRFGGDTWRGWCGGGGSGGGGEGEEEDAIYVRPES